MMLFSAHVGGEVSSIRSTALDKCVKYRLGFHACQPLSCTCMGALTEAELPGGVAADVEGVRSIPFVFVTVGRGVDDQDTRPNRNSGVADYCLPNGSS